MNPEARTLVILPGENLRRKQGSKYLKGKTRMMNPSAKINAIAAGIVARSIGERAEVLTQAGDAAGLGITEARQNQEYLIFRNPELQGRVHLEEESFDSPTISENAKKFIDENAKARNGFGRVDLVDIKSHSRRLTGQMRAWGVPLSRIHIAEDVYVQDPRITENTKRRRQRIVNKIYRGTVSIHKPKPHDIFKSRRINGIISGQMILEKSFETGLNILGKIDNKGLIAKRLLTSKTRKNA